MRFKLDENLPVELAALFREAEHDAVTVGDQELGGASDSELASICASEDRILVTFDTDFANIRTYPPETYAGLIVFRLNDQARDHVLQIGGRLLNVLRGATLSGRLWIVEESRVRVRR